MVRQDRRQHRRAGDPDLRRHPHDGRADHRRRSRARSSPRAAAAGRDLPRGCRDSRPAMRELDARALPRYSAPGLRLQPRLAAAGERLQRRARAGRHRGHLRHRARGDARTDPQPAGAVAGAFSATPTSSPRPTHVPAINGHQPDRRSKASTRARRRAAQELHRRTSISADGRRLPAGRVRRRHQGRVRASGRSLIGRRWTAAEPPRGCIRRAGAAAGLAGARGRLGATAACPGSRTRWEGWEDSAVAAGETRCLPARPAPAADERYDQARPATAISDTAACTADRLRPALTGDRAVSRVSSSAPPISSSLRGLSLRRARRRPVPRRVAAARCSALS